MPNVYEKICAVEFDRLPDVIKKVYLAPPVISTPVESDGDGFKLLIPETLNRLATDALVPKLGIKSWRDAGTLGVIYAGMNIRTIIDSLLQKPTQPQRLSATAWKKNNLPLRLHLTPYVDFSELTEVRFLANSKRCQRISICLRGQLEQDFDVDFARITLFARNISRYLPPHSHIIDVGYFPNGDTKLVEINPALTPLELSVLKNPKF